MSDAAVARSRVETQAEEETLELGRALGRHAPAGGVLALSGDLGAGKTLLTRGVFQGLGLDPERWSGSPTFVLACRYEGARPLVHADFYRLGSLTEARELALDEPAREGAVVVIEWADRFPGVLPHERVDITIRPLGDEARELTLVARASGAAAWLARALEERSPS